MEWLSPILPWLPFLVVVLLYVWWAQRRQRQLLDANREGMDALKANTEALRALRRQLEQQAKP